MNNLALAILIAGLLNPSCAANRNLVYFSDLPAAGVEMPIRNYTQPMIQPDDILTISVSSLNPESNVLFNNVILPTTANSGEIGRAHV